MEELLRKCGGVTLWWSYSVNAEELLCKCGGVAPLRSWPVEEILR